MMAISLVNRSEWQARAPRGKYDHLARTRGVKIHYTGGRIDPHTVEDHTLCAPAVRGIQRGHMDGNGWLDIGYSLIACSHRKVFVGRGLHRLPAANGPGRNAGHYAVLGLVGNSGLVVPPDDMLHGILDAIEWLRREGGAGPEIKGHRDGYATDCPGEPLYAWIKAGAHRPDAPSSGQDPGASPAPAFPGRLLAYPPITRGDDVRQWQAQAVRLGYPLLVDGAYGPASRTVCRQLQRDAGLADDGVVGPRTWRATFQTHPR